MKIRIRIGVKDLGILPFKFTPLNFVQLEVSFKDWINSSKKFVLDLLIISKDLAKW